MQFKAILFAALLSASTAAMAQDDDHTTTASNFLKVNLTSLPLKNFHLQYERVLSKRVSLALGGRLMPATTIPFKNLVLKAVAEDDQDTEDLINNSRIGNIAITPEVRFYLGKGYGKGFYIAPYYRYVNFSTNSVTLNYAETMGPERSVNLGGEMSAHTGGVMFGAQMFIGKNVSLDWWIIGAHYGSGNGSFTGVPNTPFTPGEQTEIRRILEDIDIPLTEKKVSVSSNNVSVNLDGPFGGLRAGILLGVRL
jgi:hypothetical protein